MNRLTRAILLVVSLICSTAWVSWADTIAGSTTGCFTSNPRPQGNGNITSGCNSGLATDAGLTFTQGSFDVTTDSNDFAAIGGGSNSFGDISLSSALANYAGDSFTLFVTITDPAAGLGGVAAKLIGDVMTGPSGGVTIQFTSPIEIGLSNGENLSLAVNNVSVFPSAGNSAITGTATVPEPGAMMLLGSGILSLAGIRRRWLL